MTDPGAPTTPPDWEQRVAAIWASSADMSDDDLRARVAALVAELPDDDPRGLYEKASACDSTGLEDEAVPLYRAALAGGLDEPVRRQAVIQLASTLRNVGRADEAVRLLSAEPADTGDGFDTAVRAFLALALASSGREREATGVAVGALARHVPRYRRSLTAYGAELAGEAPSAR
jgi:thioredoxin-like negative regulator of GroEL